MSKNHKASALAMTIHPKHSSWNRMSWHLALPATRRVERERRTETSSQLSAAIYEAPPLKHSSKDVATFRHIKNQSQGATILPRRAIEHGRHLCHYPHPARGTNIMTKSICRIQGKVYKLPHPKCHHTHSKCATSAP